ncbi:MAG: cadherin-like domain-containing protein [Candidatus Izemoplasmatales bacterium]
MKKIFEIILMLIAMGILPASCAEVTTTTLPTLPTTGTVVSTSTTTATTTTGSRTTTTGSTGTTTGTVTIHDAPTLSFDGPSVYTVGGDGLEAAADLKGAALVSVAIDGGSLGSGDYDLSGGILHLYAATLADLSLGNHALVLETTGGTADAAFVCNDVPTISAKDDFIKYPGEAISGEDWTGLVNDAIGALAVRYLLVSGDGVFTDRLDGSFDYVPDGIGSGTAVIRITATDEYGAFASRDVTLTYKTVDPSPIPDQAFDLDAPADVTFAVDKNGAEPVVFACDLVIVTGHGIDPYDYVLDDEFDTVTIKADYLSTLAFGTYEFLLTTTAGERAFSVAVSAHPTAEIVGTGILLKGDTADLPIDVDPKGGTLVSVAIDGTPVNASFYAFDGTRLTLAGAETGTYAPGEKTVLITLSSGTVAVGFVLNDVPVIAAKDDFIKLPGESVLAEDFRGLVTDAVGDLGYAFSLVSGAGALTDRGDGTFDFVPDSVYAGAVEIAFTVTDTYGASAERTIVLLYKTVNPFVYDAVGAKVVDKAVSFGDVVMTVDTFGSESSSLYFKMVDVKEGEDSIGAGNFILRTGGNARLFSIRASYLLTLSVGVHTFTLVTEAGASDFTIEVRDTRAVLAEPDEADYVLTVTGGDLAFAITPYAHDLDPADFTFADVAWTAGVDYAYADGILTIREGFLEARSAGDHVVSVEGVALVTIHVKNPTGPQVVAGSKTTLVARAEVVDDLIVWTSLSGREAETTVATGGVILSNEAYAVEIDRIILREAYLVSLPYGIHVFTVTNTHGSDTFELHVSDRATASEGSQNVTKYTYETIVDEPFRVTAAGSFLIDSYVFTGGSAFDHLDAQEGEPSTVQISLDGKTLFGDFGTITIDDAKDAFTFVRAPGWWGIVVFDYQATDEVGLASVFIQMDIVYLEVPPAIADATDKTFVTGGENLRWPITNASGDTDFPILKITGASGDLLLDTDYTVGPREGSILYFDLTAAYLETLAFGPHAFTLWTDGGNADFQLTVLGAPACEEEVASFDLAAPADVTFLLTGYPLSPLAITRGGVPLAPAYYVLDGDLLTIKSGFLSVQGYVDVVIRVGNATGSVDLTIVVTDSRTPELGTGPFAYGEHSMVDVEVAFSLYDDSISSILFGSATVPTAAYSYTPGILTFDGAYLESLLGTPSQLDFTIMTTGGDLTLAIAITPFTTLPEALLVSEGYLIDVSASVSYGVDLAGNVFENLTAGAATLIRDADYTFDDETGILTLSVAWMATRRAENAGVISFVIRTADGNDLSVTVPYDHRENRVENGGFETADLSGWTSFSLWKDESGMTAWTVDRVVSGTYFDGNYTYNRDGSFNLGIYGGAITKDSGQERMGYLRSSDFVLGGSGWIAFRLGGGKNDAFAYVSVRRASDDVEIARFGNRHFGDTTLSGTENAEACLFPYYYDLSAVGTLGETYYLVIADTMSNEWCVLSADSFLTYFGSAPATTSDTLAENVLPTVLGIDTATNEIKNGSFSSGLDGWSNPDGIFQVADGYAISSVGGDSATGLLRSSAFTVVGMKYLRLDWAGGLRFDKQVSISIREVGTNIEVLRFVRRDNLSTKQDGNFDNHMLDLSGLDESKLYYLEIVDNVNASWGVSKIDSIRFVSETEWNAVTSGDRAVSITGLPLAFDPIP